MKALRVLFVVRMSTPDHGVRVVPSDSRFAA